MMTDTTKTAPTTQKTEVDSAPEAVERDYFVPEYGVTVSATSLSDAVTKAKKAKGNK